MVVMLCYTMKGNTAYAFNVGALFREIMNCPKIVTVQADIYIAVKSPTGGHNEIP